MARTQASDELKLNEVKLSELYAAFFRIGGFTIGGGYVMLPMMQKEVVDKKGWVTDEDMVNYYALGSTVPGVIAINTATMVGYRKRGITGALSATAGMITPSLLIIMFIAAFLARFQEYEVVQSAFRGVRVAVFAVMVMAVVRIGKKVIKNWQGWALAIGAFFLVAALGISPVYVILATIALGAVLGVIKGNKEGRPS